MSPDSKSQCTVEVMLKLTSGQPVKDICWSITGVCPGFIGSLAKYRINLQGFLFLLVVFMLHCIFDSNVNPFVSINFFLL